MKYLSNPGLSSLSILILMKKSFIISAVRASSKFSCDMTWHQWQLEYPLEMRIGLSDAFAWSRASSTVATNLPSLSCMRAEINTFFIFNRFMGYRFPSRPGQFNAVGQKFDSRIGADPSGGWYGLWLLLKVVSVGLFGKHSSTEKCVGCGW